MMLCDGTNCRVREGCKLYAEYLKSIDLLLQTSNISYVEPAYNGSYCNNYVKIRK